MGPLGEDMVLSLDPLSFPWVRGLPYYMFQTVLGPNLTTPDKRETQISVDLDCDVTGGRRRVDGTVDLGPHSVHKCREGPGLFGESTVLRPVPEKRPVSIRGPTVGPPVSITDRLFGTVNRTFPAIW